jgi:hypothetical protein
MGSNSSRRGKMGQPNSQGQPSVRRRHTSPPGQEDLAKVEDSFHRWRKVLEKETAARIIDFNELSATGKQAALSLKNEAKVRFEVLNGRTVVMGRPNFFSRWSF